MDEKFAQQVKMEWETEQIRKNTEHIASEKTVSKSIYDDLLDIIAKIIGKDSKPDSSDDENNTQPKSFNLSLSLGSTDNDYCRVSLNLMNDLDIVQLKLYWQNVNPESVGCNFNINATERIENFKSTPKITNKLFSLDDFQTEDNIICIEFVNKDYVEETDLTEPIITKGDGEILYIDLFAPIVFSDVCFKFGYEITTAYETENGYVYNTYFSNGETTTPNITVKDDYLPVDEEYMTTEEFTNRFMLGFKSDAAIYYNTSTNMYSENSVGINVIYIDHLTNNHEIENASDLNNLLKCDNHSVYYYYNELDKDSFTNFNYYNFNNDNLLTPAPTLHFNDDSDFTIQLNSNSRINNNKVYDNIYFELLIGNGAGTRTAPIITGFAKNDTQEDEEEPSIVIPEVEDDDNNG